MAEDNERVAVLIVADRSLQDGSPLGPHGWPLGPDGSPKAPGEGRHPHKSRLDLHHPA
jgi:hypothetical protein